MVYASVAMRIMPVSLSCAVQTRTFTPTCLTGLKPADLPGLPLAEQARMEQVMSSMRVAASTTVPIRIKSSVSSTATCRC